MKIEKSLFWEDYIASFGGKFARGSTFDEAITNLIKKIK